MAMTAAGLEAYDGYMGMTPAPEDFDSFWGERMKEADSMPLVYRLTDPDIPVFDTCICQELVFTGMHGTQVYAKYLRPKTEQPVPLVLQFHGYMGSSRSWLEQGSFVGMGMAVLAFDCPGQGGFGEDRGTYAGSTVNGHIIAGVEGSPEGMYYVRFHQNMRILCRIIREWKEIDLSRVYVNGNSQGGALSIACAALNPDLISRAGILYPFLSDFRLVWELGADDIAYASLRYYSRWRDPDDTRMEQWFRNLGYIDSKNFAHMVKCPVLFGTGLVDIVCPPQTQCAVYNNLQCAKKRLLFPGFGHEEIQDFDDAVMTFFSKREVCL